MNDRIQIDPKIGHGRPVIRDTRVLVSTILGALGAVDSNEDVLTDYPNITLQVSQAALAFGGDIGQCKLVMSGYLLRNL